VHLERVRRPPAAKMRTVPAAVHTPVLIVGGIGHGAVGSLLLAWRRRRVAYWWKVTLSCRSTRAAAA
jgi:hypothetical protein